MFCHHVESNMFFITGKRCRDTRYLLIRKMWINRNGNASREQLFRSRKWGISAQIHKNFLLMAWNRILHAGIDAFFIHICHKPFPAICLDNKKMIGILNALAVFLTDKTGRTVQTFLIIAGNGNLFLREHIERFQLVRQHRSLDTLHAHIIAQLALMIMLVVFLQRINPRNVFGIFADDTATFAE